ncbi:hypothetical protein AZE42_02670 [Rhizopogon vesiculosus]|uniref:Uncharacterized protein n=1 Tax=Rhizopogon vesiculosus TaxID=180088 RepID=A0A1J8QSI5_9AGAM|nr:hypothetical protein AZE42_02670 [Rhizopogon vesiculosus]
MSSPSSFSRSKAYDEILKEYNITEHSAKEFRSITIGDLSDEKSTLVNFIIRKLEHHKEARGHSKWEHEFLVAHMYHPKDSEIAGVLLIDRENRPIMPDIVRVIPGDTLRSTPLPHILSRLGYHPSNLGRACALELPHSVGEMASVLAEKGEAGGEYSSRDRNCYWYANAVFKHCSHTYGGKITKGPYYDDLGHYMGGAPRNLAARGFVNFVRCGSCIAVGLGLGIDSLPLTIGGITFTAASMLAKRAWVSQAEPVY